MASHDNSPNAREGEILRKDAVGEQALENENAAIPKTALRDPFARPGMPGNRGIRYESDDSIPTKYRSKVDKAIELAYRLAFQPHFNEVFRKTVSTLSGKELPRDVYFRSLEKMVIHYAETSKDARLLEALRKDEEARKSDSNYKLPPAYSTINGEDVWLREFQLQKKPKAIAGSIMHEAAHLAGAPTDLLAEIALESIHNAGYAR